MPDKKKSGEQTLLGRDERCIPARREDETLEWSCTKITLDAWLMDGSQSCQR
jgi:hypothetical protein